MSTDIPFAAVGPALARYGANDKVTGRTPFPADVPVARPLYAFPVLSKVARGTVVSIDDSGTRAVPGVVAVYSHLNAPNIAPPQFLFRGGRAMGSLQPLSSPKIYHDGQMTAMIVAESYEAAREGAYALDIDYAAEPVAATLGSPGSETVAAAAVNPFHRDLGVGDPETALKLAPVTIVAEYSTSTQHHNPIELFSTTAVWQGDELTIHESSQFIYSLQHEVARQLDIIPAKVHIVSPFIGGAFGSKGPVSPRTAIVAWIARQLDRPVKLVYTRAQGFTTINFRAETRHRLRLGATREGKMTAYTHDAWELTSRYDDFLVGGTANTVHLYDIPNIATMVHLERADRATPGFMRSPPEVPYMFALESAVDELAVALAMDPVELRRRNDTMKSPIDGTPYTSRSLLRCFDEASAAFGWAKRDPRPGSMRDGDWAIGWGCATSSFPMNMMAATASVSLDRDGQVTVKTSAVDVGTGAYTVIGQTAAHYLGVSPDAVTVELGDSRLPAGPVAGGSRTTASACSAVKLACDRIKTRLGEAVPCGGASARAFDALGVTKIGEMGEFVPYGSHEEAVKAINVGTFGGMTLGTAGPVLVQAFGAQMVEVRVNRYTREIRVPRIVGAFAAGRILNARTAKSQLMGAMIWGIGSALHEKTEIEEHSARYTNKDFGDYHIAVNADVPSVEAIIVPETDDAINPIGVKGIGELGNVGTDAAVANAVFHATGKRIGDLPITIDKLFRQA